MMASFQDTYSGFKRTKPGRGDDGEKRPPATPCVCGGEPAIGLGNATFICFKCYERRLALSPTQVRVLARRINVPDRQLNENAHPYFLRAYSASTEAPTDD